MIIKKGIIFGLIVLFLASCAVRKAPRKCDGKKGVKTRMGTM